MPQSSSVPAWKCFTRPSVFFRGYLKLPCGLCLGSDVLPKVPSIWPYRCPGHSVPCGQHLGGPRASGAISPSRDPQLSQRMVTPSIWSQSQEPGRSFPSSPPLLYTQSLNKDPPVHLYMSPQYFSPLGLHHLGLILTWSSCHQTSLKSTLLMATCVIFPPATHVTFFSCWRLQWLPKCMDLTSVVLCNLAQHLTAYPACSGHPPRPHILAPSLLWSTHTWDSDLCGLFAFSDLPGPIKLPCFCMWQALCLKALNSHFLAWQLQGTLILFASRRHEQFCFLSSFRLPSALCHSLVNLCFLACFLH